MTNQEIICNEAIAHEIYTKEQVEALISTFTDLGLHTYGDWKNMGYQVRKGEKARIKTKLWKKTSKKVKNKEGKDEKESKFYLCNAYLFTKDQVDKIKEEN